VTEDEKLVKIIIHDSLGAAKIHIKLNGNLVRAVTEWQAD